MDENQSLALQQVRERFRDRLWEEDTDEALLRFYENSHRKIKKTLKSLNEYLQWRESIGLRNLSYQDFLPELPTGKVFFMGHDKRGRPALIIRSAKHFPSRQPREMTLKMSSWCMAQTIARLPRGVSTCIAIVDFSGNWSRKNVDTKFDRELLKIVQFYFPQRLDAVMLVNYPKYVKFVFTLISPFIEKDQRRKITWIPNSAGLLEHFDTSVLPDFLGGTNTDYPHPIETLAHSAAPAPEGAEGGSNQDDDEDPDLPDTPPETPATPVESEASPSPLGEALPPMGGPTELGGEDLSPAAMCRRVTTPTAFPRVVPPEEVSGLREGAVDRVCGFRVLNALRDDALSLDDVV
eukprot:gnl/Trimastix_PCT/2021.p1 GENE.gnl/Trimastix_PCT/2021~~gnl/Trimastix_PCT/2021.p1  ORF type:complete len:362 (+),score=62.70 gnl/Trimastix_PCT/2021:38-1087(+)